MTTSSWTLDITVAWRGWRRTPITFAAVVVSLAFGVGLTLAVFGIARALAYPELPYLHSASLIAVQDMRRVADGQFLTAADVRTIDSRHDALQSVAAYRGGVGGRYALLATIGGRKVAGIAVTPNFLSVLGVHPVRGRSSHAEDAAEPVAIISDQTATVFFGKNEAAIGSRLMIGGSDYTVIGVTPQGFWFPYAEADFWIPENFATTDAAVAGRGATGSLSLVGRLAPQRTIADATREIRVVVDGQRGSVGPRRELSVEHFADVAIAGDHAVIMLLVGFVSSILVLSCASATSLLLARAIAQTRALAVRAALGASPLQLLRVPAIETALTVGIAGVLGIGTATTALRVATSVIPGFTSASLLAGWSPNGAFIVASAAAIVFALLTVLAFPARYAARLDATIVLRAGARAVASGSERIVRRLLVGVQLVLATVLIAIALLFARDVRERRDWKPTFPTAGLLVGNVEISKSESAAGLEAIIRARIGSDADIASAGIEFRVPLADGVVRAGGASTMASAMLHVVTNRYLQTMAIPLLRGRLWSDQASSDEEAIIDSKLARSLFGATDPVGRLVQFETANGRRTSRVIGIVPPIAWERQSRDAGALFTLGAPTTAQVATIAVRLRDAHHVRAVELQQLDRAMASVSHSAFRSASSILAERERPYRITAVLTAILAVLALVVSATAIYGITDQFVTESMVEIGIRTALGASARQTGRFIAFNVTHVALISLPVGGAVAAVVIVVIRSLIESSAAITSSVAGAILTAAAVCLAASAGPAIRAIRIDPARLLRGGAGTSD